MNQRDSSYAKWLGIVGGVSLLAAALLEYWPSSNPLSWLTLDEARAAAATQNKPMFVDVYADWCAPCKEMDRTVFPDDSVKTILTGKYILAKVNGDDPTHGEMMRKQFGIRAYPTYIVLSPSGKERKRTVGFMQKSNLIRWLNDSTGVTILLWPDLDKAFQNAASQKKRVMVLILQSGDEIERTNALFEEGNLTGTIDRNFIPTLLVRGNAGEEKLLEEVNASPKTGMSEIIVFGDKRNEVGRFFVTTEMHFRSLALANKLMEYAPPRTH